MAARRKPHVANPFVLIEPGVFSSQECIDYMLGNLIQSFDESFLLVEDTDHRAVICIERGDGSRLILLQLRHFREIVGIDHIGPKEASSHEDWNLDQDEEGNNKKGSEEKSSEKSFSRNFHQKYLHGTIQTLITMRSSAFTIGPSNC